jgi:hypothetical protein
LVLQQIAAPNSALAGCRVPHVSLFRDVGVYDPHRGKAAVSPNFSTGAPQSFTRTAPSPGRRRRGSCSSATALALPPSRASRDCDADSAVSPPASSSCGH